MENNDLLSIVDGTVPLTYKRMDTGATKAISRAFMRRSRKMIDYPNEAPIVPVIWNDWYFSTLDLGPMPYPGDTLTESNGTVWTIQRAIPTEKNAVYRCLSFRYDVRFSAEEKADLLDSSDVVYDRNVLVKCSAKTTTVTRSEESQESVESFYVLSQANMQAHKLSVIRLASGSRYLVKKIREPEIKGGWSEIDVFRNL